MIKTIGSSLATDQHSRLYRRIRGHTSDHAREYKKYSFVLLRNFLFVLFFFFLKKYSRERVIKFAPSSQLQSKS